jgi:outer membrane lipopolysaccharide assembly protein LptE/RlpB
MRSERRPSWCGGRAAGLAGLVVALMLATAGCGYGLAGRTGQLPERVRTVGIPPLANATAFQQIEQTLTQRLRTELIGRGRYRVVPDATGADAVLSGTIAAVTLEPVGFSDQQRATRYLFTLTMNARLVEAGTDEVLWVNDALVFREEYELATRAVGDIGADLFVDQERGAFERIAGDVARTIVTSLLQGS